MLLSRGMSGRFLTSNKDNIPSPDIQALVRTVLLLHEVSNEDILTAMITVNMARDFELHDGLMKQAENRCGMVVVVDANTNHLACLAIDETMDDDLVANEA